MTVRHPVNDLERLESAKSQIWKFMGSFSALCFALGLGCGVMNRSSNLTPNWDPTAVMTALLGVGVTLFIGTQIGQGHWDDDVEAARSEVLLVVTLVVCLTGSIVAWLTVPQAWPALPEAVEGAGIGVLLSCLAGIVQPSPSKYRRARGERDLKLLREGIDRLDHALPGTPDTKGNRRTAWLNLTLLGLYPIAAAFLIGLASAAAHHFRQVIDMLVGMPLATGLFIDLVYVATLSALQGTRKSRALKLGWRSNLLRPTILALVLGVVLLSLVLSALTTGSWGPLVLISALIVVGAVLGLLADKTRWNGVLLRRALRKQVVEIRRNLANLPSAPRPPAPVTALPVVAEIVVPAAPVVVVPQPTAARDIVRGIVAGGLRRAAGWFDDRPVAQ